MKTTHPLHQKNQKYFPNLPQNASYKRQIQKNPAPLSHTENSMCNLSDSFSNTRTWPPFVCKRTDECESGREKSAIGPETWIIVCHRQISRAILHSWTSACANAPCKRRNVNIWRFWPARGFIASVRYGFGESLTPMSVAVLIPKSEFFYYKFRMWVSVWKVIEGGEAICGTWKKI